MVDAMTVGPKIHSYSNVTYSLKTRLSTCKMFTKNRSCGLRHYAEFKLSLGPPSTCQQALLLMRALFSRFEYYFHSFQKSNYSRQLKAAMATNTDKTVDISELRKKYAGDDDSFIEENLPAKDPFTLFEIWFKQVLNTPSIGEPNAMAVASCNKDGYPSVRMVLLKKYDKDGFCFYTNYNSRKGMELTENNKAALLFFWEPLSRQIRIEGEVEKIPENVAEEYFNRRPKKSQVSASISPQSQVTTRKYLQEKYDEEMKKYENSPVPRPAFWGGFRIIPKYFEFWQGTSHRLHDRIIFRRLKESETPDENILHSGNDGWVYERLGP